LKKVERKEKKMMTVHEREECGIHLSMLARG